jgi:NADH-quinone oxidoreductase subunit I
MFGLGLLKGLGVTMRHFVDSFVYDRKPWEWLFTDRYDTEWLAKNQDVDGKGMFTLQYPEQRRTLPENFRFLPMLVYEETPDNPRCTACGICARVCPPQCIWIERATDEKGRPSAHPAGFWIDAVVCMSCGYCAEYCPFDAIRMNQVYELATTNRDRDMFLSLEKLLVPVQYYAQLHPSDYAAEEEVRRAKEEAKRQAAEKPVVAEKAADKPSPAAPAPAPAAVQDEDLARIEGIDDEIAGVLRSAGIRSFAQLAESEPERLRAIVAEAKPELLQGADPAGWPKQARLAAAGKWEALGRLQEKMKASKEG